MIQTEKDFYRAFLKRSNYLMFPNCVCTCVSVFKLNIHLNTQRTEYIKKYFYISKENIPANQETKNTYILD